MAKGSGSTKGAANGHKQSLTFTAGPLNGEWNMDVPGVGGGQILRADGLGGVIKYEAYAWDKDYNMFDDGKKKEFATLNAAKDYIKDAVAPKSVAEVNAIIKQKGIGGILKDAVNNALGNPIATKGAASPSNAIYVDKLDKNGNSFSIGIQDTGIGVTNAVKKVAKDFGLNVTKDTANSDFSYSQYIVSAPEGKNTKVDEAIKKLYGLK